jgi:hypothetical protein
MRYNSASFQKAPGAFWSVASRTGGAGLAKPGGLCARGWSYFCIRYADTKLLWGLQGNPYGPYGLGFLPGKPGKKCAQIPKL